MPEPVAVAVFGVEPFRIGGTEAWCREISRQLGKRGWRVVLCFLKPPTEAVRRFLDLPNLSFEVIENTWKTDAEAMRALWRLLRRVRPRVLHLHYVGLVGPYVWLARLAGVRSIFLTDHTSQPEGFTPHRATLWKRAAVRLINAPLDQVICVSDYGHRCDVERGLLPASFFRRIYNSVDFSMVDQARPDPAAFRRKHGIPDGRLIVVQVSWIIPEKGIADLLEAARRVVAEFPGVHFVLVGEGKHRAEFTALAARLGIAGHVTFTGLVENPMAEGVYAAADVVCQMSRWGEVFGWVNTEAMAFRRPVVATRVGGIPEIVDDGVTGFLVEKGDTPAMARQILQLLRDPGLRQRFGEAGRARCLARFELRANVAQVVEMYLKT
ncbi:MAG: glycosyltransferase family 4 protein [Bryobacteraceae bacterium]